MISSETLPTSSLLKFIARGHIIHLGTFTALKQDLINGENLR